MLYSFLLSEVVKDCDILVGFRLKIGRRAMATTLTRVSVNYKESNTFSQKVTYSIGPRIK